MIRALTSVALAAMASASVEQIHLSYTGIVGQLSVDFVTSAKVNGQLQWGTDGTTFPNSQDTTSFAANEIGYVHQAMMDTKAPAGQPIFYRVGSAAEWSATYKSVPLPARGDQEIFAVFGDFGIANDVCMDTLVKDAAAGVFDSVLHVGDWAYDFEDANSTVGNSFMNAVQGYGAIVPIMPAAGNHEQCDHSSELGGCQAIPELPYSNANFTQYKARLHAVTLNAGANAGTNNNIYYSFNQGITHYIVFSAEAYIYSVDPGFIANQLAFMKKDLAAVDRKATPWVVALVHKDWTMMAKAYADFYPILEAGGVDVLFCGHVHYYNRYLPYDAITGKVDTKAANKDGSVYTNPEYLVNVVTGASGDREDDSKCSGSKIASPSFTCTQNYGYGIWQAINATVAKWSFKTVKADGSGPADYSDSLTIIQDAHGPRRA